MRSGRGLALLLLALTPATLAADSPVPRWLTVELELAPSARAWWKKPLPAADIDGVLLSWGLTLFDTHGRVQALPSQPACPQDPFCRAWDPKGSQCLDFFAPGLPEWDSRYTCYADGRTVFFDQEQTLTELTIPEGIDEARLTLYFRDDDFRRQSWPARAVDGEAAIVFRLDPEPGFRLAASLRLGSGPDGRPADLQIASCRPAGGDPEKLAQQIRSAEFRYCEAAQLGASVR